MTARVLFYADPHPIRNGFFEFNEAAHRMHAMASEAAFAEIDWRLFSNQYILGDVATKGDAARLIWPTTEESECISSFLQEWNQEAIAARTDLVRGEGPAADFYRAVLGRIKDEFDFTHVVLWSENGAVRRFAAGAGVGVIHAELGPIRSPFKKTIYFDPFGTNANACLAGVTQEDLSGVRSLPRATWLADCLTEQTTSPSARELSQLPLPDGLRGLWRGDYVVVAMQLADDLNTVLHSPFDSPRGFLEMALPPLVDRGFRVLVKGHPAASLRPFNLIQECSALRYAETLGPQVTILPRKMPADEFLPLCQNASAVLSINSSVSFESWLLGTPGLALGGAVYDVGSDLLTWSRRFVTSGESEPPDLDRVYSFLFQHYLVPDEHPYASSVLAEMVASYSFDGSPADYVRWLSRFNHSSRLLGAESHAATLPQRLQSAIRAAVDGSETLRMHIDRQVSNHSVLELDGWIGRKSAAHVHPECIAIFHGDHPMSIVQLRARQDVVQVFPHISLFNAFSVRETLPEGTDPGTLRLVALADSKAYVMPINLPHPAKTVRQRLRTWLGW